MYVAETRSMRSSMLPEQTMDQSFPSAPLMTLERPGMLSAQLLPVVSSTPFPLKFWFVEPHCCGLSLSCFCAVAPPLLNAQIGSSDMLFSRAFRAS